jgi:hypothetical protein
MFMIGNAPASAQLFVGKTGNDANDCASPSTACLTIQAAVNKVPGGSLGVDISVAPGTYAERVNIFYARAMRIFGDCNDLSAVQIATSGVGIWVQDHAIGIIQCLTITATVNGAIGIAARQFPIVDIERVRFSGFPQGLHIALSESSRLSCIHGPNGEPVVVTGGADTFAAATGGSHLYLNCPVSFEGTSGQSFSYFTQCTELSVCKYHGLSWKGANIAGKQMNCDNSDVTLPNGVPPTGFTASIPGTGVDNPDSRCKIR